MHTRTHKINGQTLKVSIICEKTNKNALMLMESSISFTENWNVPMECANFQQKILNQI